ncbi:MAG: enoyl-CoA hydratase/isomerase family protein [Anaerolineales bacterium]|nr:enoyl-CoA hydratase/isomerase family protein [Anaerolineales bacterium]
MFIFKAGVIGAGAMGAEIAQVISYSGLPVVLKDIDQSMLDKGIARIREIYQRRVDKGKMSPSEMTSRMDLITPSLAWDEFADVDLLIEAVPEKIEIKAAVFKEAALHCPAETIFASNTSALSITEMGHKASRPEKMIGMHFFNPAHVMKLVEIIPGDATSQETVDDVVAFTESLRKIPVVVKECPGFLVNRLLMPYLNEATLALQEGHTSAQEIDEAMVAFGMPMGPFTLMDMLGLDVCVDVGAYLTGQYGDRMAAAVLLPKLVEAGRLGEKAGAGFYGYGGRSYEPVKELAAQANAEQPAPEKATFSVNRLVLPLINEAAMALQEGIADVKDIDMAMIAGTGMTYQRQRMGPLQIADLLGIPTVLDELETLQKIHGARFKPANIFSKLVEQGRTGRAVNAGFLEYAPVEEQAPKAPVDASAKEEPVEPARQYIKISVEDRVATLTIDHPPVNAFNPQVVEELSGAVDELNADTDVKVVVITGAGQIAFVAGADITEFDRILKEKDIPAGERMLRMGQETFTKIENSPKPYIAAINAVCLGGGLELAMACHLRIAGDRVRLGQPEINLGIIPGWGGTQRLQRIIGPSHAAQMILTGNPITAQEAAKLGLVNKVVPGGAVLKEAMGLAKIIAGKSAVAIKAAMNAIRNGMDADLSSGLRAEATQFKNLFDSYDMQEGISAFLKKRKPEFKDR